MPEQRLGSSFRDPHGFLFEQDRTLLRHVSPRYAQAYGLLTSSGLYADLVQRGELVPHVEVDSGQSPGAWKVIKPERVPFVSYPYEWSFPQLREAALLTLRIQRAALGHGMILKDASAYNVLFRRGRPTFIDTLSFAPYQDGQPWWAYRQFCEHFLGPLALAAYVDPAATRMLQLHLDGVPLTTVRRALPLRARVRPGLFLHIVMHARGQERFRPGVGRSSVRVSRLGVIGLVESLSRTIENLRPRAASTPWAAYGSCLPYSLAAVADKRDAVEEWARGLHGATVLDLGANDGTFTRVCAKHAAQVIALDGDPTAIAASYRASLEQGVDNIDHVLADITNLPQGVGWAGRERDPLCARVQADALMALALVHHLVLSANLSFSQVAEGFAELAPRALVEFVPAEDPMATELLARHDPEAVVYDERAFIQAMSERFLIVARRPLKDSSRVLFDLSRKSP